MCVPSMCVRALREPKKTHMVEDEKEEEKHLDARYETWNDVFQENKSTDKFKGKKNIQTFEEFLKF